MTIPIGSRLMAVAGGMLTKNINDIERPTKKEIRDHRKRVIDWAKEIADIAREIRAMSEEMELLRGEKQH
jgi:hypothetical protein